MSHQEIYRLSFGRSSEFAKATTGHTPAPALSRIDCRMLANIGR
jgi:hypothetical protein